MILISPHARPLRNGQPNPKNYPFWSELTSLIPYPMIQVGAKGESQLVPNAMFDLDLAALAQQIKDCDTWISVDSFFQHYAWSLNKPGIVLWGQSDPLIFGHHSNVNLLLDRSYLRQQQFWLWEQAEYRTDCWVKPSVVVEALDQFFKEKR